jgi:hypothetical protein
VVWAAVSIISQIWAALTYTFVTAFALRNGLGVEARIPWRSIVLILFELLERLVFSLTRMAHSFTSQGVLSLMILDLLLSCPVVRLMDGFKLRA